MKDLSIMIPCYNEGLIIEDTYNQLKLELEKYSYDYEILFCNDGSTDNTLQILKKIESKDKTVRIITYPQNIGPGYAYKQIYKNVRGNVAIQMDADLSMRPEDIIPKFMKEIINFDVVVGSRYSGIKAEYPFYKVIVSRVYSLMNKILFNFNIKDTQSGFFAFKKKVLDSLNLRFNGFEVHVEIFDQIIKKNFKIKEIPLKFIHVTDSRETSILKVGPKMLINTFKIWFNSRIRKAN